MYLFNGIVANNYWYQHVIIHEQQVWRGHEPRIHTYCQCCCYYWEFWWSLDRVAPWHHTRYQGGTPGHSWGLVLCNILVCVLSIICNKFWLDAASVSINNSGSSITGRGQSWAGHQAVIIGEEELGLWIRWDEPQEGNWLSAYQLDLLLSSDTVQRAQNNCPDSKPQCAFNVIWEKIA